MDIIFSFLWWGHSMACFQRTESYLECFHCASLNHCFSPRAVVQSAWVGWLLLRLQTRATLPRLAVYLDYKLTNLKPRPRMTRMRVVVGCGEGEEDGESRQTGLNIDSLNAGQMQGLKRSVSPQPWREEHPCGSVECVRARVVAVLWSS